MKIQTWHIPIPEKVSFEEIKKQLLGKGFISVVDEAGKIFRKYTEPFKITIPFPFVTIPSSDLLSSQDGNALCYTELVKESEETQRLDLIVISEDELVASQLLTDCESAFGEQKLIKGTSQEAQIAKRLKKELKQSTHGRMLSDPEFISSLEVLCDSSIREQFHSFVETFGDSAISGAIIEEIFPKVKRLKKSEVRRLINDERLFSKQFSIGCNRCGTSHLTFPTNEEAQESLNHSISRKCFRCGENALDVIETFKLREAFLKGLTQGLWLEYLVHQVVQPLSIFSIAGVVLENFEMDVVSLTAENVILFECKDTSFGERDFWMSVPKAQALNANTLWIVTTEPLHENVKRIIEGQKRQVRFEIFITEGLVDQHSITSNISQKLEQVQNSLLRHLFTRESELYRLLPTLRRSFLTRPTGHL